MLYLQQKYSLILSLVYACIGSVAEASSTKNDGGNPWRTSRLMPRGVLVVAYSCCRRINTTTSLVVLFHLPRAERFVRHALLAEPTFLDLRRGCSFYPSLGNSEEMVNSTFPSSIGTFFTQTHSPESRAPGRRPCEEAVGRPLGHLPLDVHWGAFFRFPLHRRMKED